MSFGSGGKSLSRARLVAFVPCLQPIPKVRAGLLVGRVKFVLASLHILVSSVIRKKLAGGRIEKQRWLFKLVKYKNQDAKHQDAKLHGDFADGVKHETEPAFPQRRAGNVALNL